jgi:Asp-tRNA(Asn)/Glu-tRNA(Gln) amidotransferase A subunit family amidase
VRRREVSAKELLDAAIARVETSREGLPIGVQFVAPFGDEARLFRLGAQLEAAQPWADRRPHVD